MGIINGPRGVHKGASCPCKVNDAWGDAHRSPSVSRRLQNDAKYSAHCPQPTVLLPLKCGQCHRGTRVQLLCREQLKSLGLENRHLQAGWVRAHGPGDQSVDGLGTVLVILHPGKCIENVVSNM